MSTFEPIVNAVGGVVAAKKSSLLDDVVLGVLTIPTSLYFPAIGLSITPQDGVVIDSGDILQAVLVPVGEFDSDYALPGSGNKAYRVLVQVPLKAKYYTPTTYLLTFVNVSVSAFTFSVASVPLAPYAVPISNEVAFVAIPTGRVAVASVVVNTTPTYKVRVVSHSEGAAESTTAMSNAVAYVDYVNRHDPEYIESTTYTTVRLWCEFSTGINLATSFRLVGSYDDFTNFHTLRDNKGEIIVFTLSAGLQVSDTFLRNGTVVSTSPVIFYGDAVQRTGSTDLETVVDDNLYEYEENGVFYEHIAHFYVQGGLPENYTRYLYGEDTPHLSDNCFVRSYTTTVEGAAATMFVVLYENTNTDVTRDTGLQSEDIVVQIKDRAKQDTVTSSFTIAATRPMTIAADFQPVAAGFLDDDDDTVYKFPSSSIVDGVLGTIAFPAGITVDLPYSLDSDTGVLTVSTADQPASRVKRTCTFHVTDVGHATYDVDLEFYLYDDVNIVIIDNETDKNAQTSLVALSTQTAYFAITGGYVGLVVTIDASSVSAASSTAPAITNGERMDDLSLTTVLSSSYTLSDSSSDTFSRTVNVVGLNATTGTSYAHFALSGWTIGVTPSISQTTIASTSVLTIVQSFAKPFDQDTIHIYSTGYNVSLAIADVFVGGDQRVLSYSSSSSEVYTSITTPSFEVSGISISVRTGSGLTEQTYTLLLVISIYLVPVFTDVLEPSPTRRLVPRLPLGNAGLGTTGVNIGYTDLDSEGIAEVFAFTGVTATYDAYATPAVSLGLSDLSVPVTATLEGVNPIVTVTPPSWSDFLAANRTFEAGLYTEPFFATIVIDERARVEDNTNIYQYTGTDVISWLNPANNNTDGKQSLVSTSKAIPFKFVHTPLLEDKLFETSQTVESLRIYAPIDGASFTGILSTFPSTFTADEVLFIIPTSEPTPSSPTYDPSASPYAFQVGDDAPPSVSTTSSMTASREEQYCIIRVTQESIVSIIVYPFYLYAPLVTQRLSSALEILWSDTASRAVNGGYAWLLVTGGYVGLDVSTAITRASSTSTLPDFNNVTTDATNVIFTLQSVNNMDYSGENYTISTGAVSDILAYTVSSTLLQSESYFDGTTAYFIVNVSRGDNDAGDLAVFQSLRQPFGGDPLNIYMPNVTPGITPRLLFSALFSGGDLGGGDFETPTVRYTDNAGDNASSPLALDSGNFVLESYLSETHLMITTGTGATTETQVFPFTVHVYTPPSVTLYEPIPVLYPQITRNIFDSDRKEPDTYVGPSIGYIDDSGTSTFRLCGINIVRDDTLGSVSFVIKRDGGPYDASAEGWFNMNITAALSGAFPVISLAPGGSYAFGDYISSNRQLSGSFLASEYGLEINVVNRVSSVNLPGGVTTYRGTYYCTAEFPVIDKITDENTDIFTAVQQLQTLYFEEINMRLLGDDTYVDPLKIMVNRNVHPLTENDYAQNDVTVSGTFFDQETSILASESGVLTGAVPSNTFTTLRVYATTPEYVISSEFATEIFTFHVRTNTSTTSDDDLELDSSSQLDNVVAVTCAVPSNGGNYCLVIERRNRVTEHLTKKNRNGVAIGDKFSDFLEGTFFRIQIYDFDPVTPIASTLSRLNTTLALSTQFPDCCHLFLDQIASSPDGTGEGVAVNGSSLVYSIQVRKAGDSAWVELFSNIDSTLPNTTSLAGVNLTTINEYLQSLPERMLTGNVGTAAGDTDFTLPSYADSSSLMLEYRVMAQQKTVYTRGTGAKGLVIVGGTYAISTHRSNLVGTTLQYRDYKAVGKPNAFRTAVMDDGSTFNPSTALTAVRHEVTTTVSDTIDVSSEDYSRLTALSTIYGFDFIPA